MLSDPQCSCQHCVEAISNPHPLTAKTEMERQKPECLVFIFAECLPVPAGKFSLFYIDYLF